MLQNVILDVVEQFVLLHAQSLRFTFPLLLQILDIVLLVLIVLFVLNSGLFECFQYALYFLKCFLASFDLREEWFRERIGDVHHMSQMQLNQLLNGIIGGLSRNNHSEVRHRLRSESHGREILYWIDINILLDMEDI